MLIIRIIIYSLIFLGASLIGILVSKKYANRVRELREFKSGLHMFKTKMRFTYEPIPDIFQEISKGLNSNIGTVFSIASNNMKLLTAGRAWELAIENTRLLNINEEDKKALQNLSRLLGKTDVQGQVSQIEITESILDEQITKAEIDRKRSEKMYRSLGMIIGLAIVIILL
ncbi:MAG: hypothetical protein FWC79_00510 [Oscillospiraceae bacterium]|nr:hypothetical protein [Oscillospiraceae bacterium]